MARAKNMNLFLMDGTAQGRIKCTLANWTGVAYKLPRKAVNASKQVSLLQQTGVYFLFGESKEDAEPQVYVGQAGIRKNGQGILCRLDEHIANGEKDRWNVAVAFTTSNNSFGPTEISYLEKRFYHMAAKAKRYRAMNGNEPNPGNLTEEKEAELEEYIEFAELVIAALGFPVFNPLRQEVSQDDDQLPLLHCQRAGSAATGQWTNDGFVVFKGSQLRKTLVPSCPEGIKKKRVQYADRISPEHKLLEDTLFNSPSTAAAFITGSSVNGWVEWKDEQGVSLSELEKGERMQTHLR
ncbi:MAG: GIY-YIG nuclease family protein [Eubacteriales bacterium]|nr:GIY-YIG nuclease family protein [Eubacteriales bacterium]